MYPVLHAVSRLIEYPQPDRHGLAAEVAEALAGEPRLSMATRLGLVSLASRIEAGNAAECARRWQHAFRTTPERSLRLRDHCGGDARALELPDSYLPALLEALSRGDESRALEALVACAPALREMAEALARQRDAYALLPVALLELLASRLH
jgi:nitrate reductase assembly molybdenum cofactor insertion protein NarJ